MDKEQRIRQILYRQHLTNPADKITVCRDLNGLQAQFLSNACYGLKIRCNKPLSDDRWGEGLVKSWTVRGTIHVFAEEDLPLFLYQGRTHFLRPVDQMVEDEYITLKRKQYFADYILQQIGEGIEERDALKEACFAAGMTETEGKSVFDPWGGTIRYLAETGKICHKIQQKKAFQLCPAFEPMSREAAQLEMTRRYFLHFGPASVKDAAYYFGCSQSTIKTRMKKLPLREQRMDGIPCYDIDDGQDGYPDIPDCIFLSGFDQLMLGYEKQQSPFLRPEHIRGIFNLAGIIMPAVLLHGEVIGRWKRKKNALEITLFTELSKIDGQILERAAAKTFGPIQMQLVRP